MDNGIIQRIDQFLKCNNITVGYIERTAKMSQAALWKAIKNNRSITTAYLPKIVECMKDCNTDWLLTGEGEMMKQNDPKQNGDIIHDPESSLIQKLSEIIRQKDMQISLLLENYMKTENEE